MMEILKGILTYGKRERAIGGCMAAARVLAHKDGVLVWVKH